MATYCLKPLDKYNVEKEEINTVLVPSADLTVFIQGDGSMTYVCQNCDQTILKQIRQNQIENVGFECPTCGSLLYLPPHNL